MSANGAAAGLILPGVWLERDKADEAEVERHRFALVCDIAHAGKQFSVQHVMNGVRAARNALDASMPGATIGEALTAHLLVAANLTGEILDSLDPNPDTAAVDGRIKACLQAFESILRNRQRFMAQQRLARRMAKLSAMKAGSTIQ